MGDMLSAREAAALLGVARATVLRWARAGLLPATRVGPKLIRFSRADVLAAVRAVRREGSHG